MLSKALHVVSDVVLDSYPAGGCTTTREALELGKAVVTLPAKYLGARWSLASDNSVLPFLSTLFFLTSFCLTSERERERERERRSAAGLVLLHCSS